MTKGHIMDTDTATTLQERMDSYVAALNDSSGRRHHFIAQKGRKYTKIIDDLGGSIHAFIDAEGVVYKPAGWSRPAPHGRYLLLDDGSWLRLLAQAKRPEAYAGGYLYITR